MGVPSPLLAEVAKTTNYLLRIITLPPIIRCPPPMCPGATNHNSAHQVSPSVPLRPEIFRPGFSHALVFDHTLIQVHDEPVEHIVAGCAQPYRTVTDELQFAVDRW